MTASSLELDVFTPDGQLAFATTVTGPGRLAASLSDAAVDGTGHVAVALGFKDEKGEYKRAIALLEMLNLFDKDGSAWKPVSPQFEESCAKQEDLGTLMDADGEQLVMAKDHGATLEWVKP